MRSQIQLLRAASLTLLVALFVLLPAAPADASILGLSQLRVDFTKPTEVAKQVRWDDTDRFVSTNTGLGRASDKRGSRDVDLHITKALALGVWWRPPSSASIKARVTWAGKYAKEMPGDLFVRHSPDARNWTAWQSVGRVGGKEKSATVSFAGTLAIRRAARVWYHRQLRAYAKRDIPWTSNEEAAVTWMLEQHPDIFERSKPFIGYVQFLYEASIPDDTRIVSFEADVTWAVSGISAIPKDKAVEAIQRKREDDPWSFKADYSHVDPTRARRREIDEKAIYELVLRRVLDRVPAYTPSFKGGVTQLIVNWRTNSPRDWDRAEFPTRLRETQRFLAKAFGVHDAVISRDLVDRTTWSRWLPPDLHPGVHVVLVGPPPGRDEHDCLPRTKKEWAEHWRRWPGSAGPLFVNPLGLNLELTQAIVSVGRAYRRGSSYLTKFHLMKTKKGDWVVAREVVEHGY